MKRYPLDDIDAEHRKGQIAQALGLTVQAYAAAHE
jgi:hypothetical protein